MYPKRADKMHNECRAFTPLPDQDRIFQNIYGEHDTSLKGAMKYGDWHMTDKIVQKVLLPLSDNEPRTSALINHPTRRFTPSFLFAGLGMDHQ